MIRLTRVGQLLLSRKQHIQQIARCAVDNSFLTNRFGLLRGIKIEGSKRCYSLIGDHWCIRSTIQKRAANCSNLVARRLCDESEDSVQQRDNAEQPSLGSHQEIISKEALAFLQHGSVDDLKKITADLPSAYIAMYAHRVAEICLDRKQSSQLAFFVPQIWKLWQKASLRGGLSSSIVGPLKKIVTYVDEKFADFDRADYLQCLAHFARFPSMNVKDLLAKARENYKLDDLKPAELVWFTQAFSYRHGDDKLNAEVLESVGEVVTEKMSEFSPAGLVQLLSSLAYADVRNRELFKLADRRLCSELDKLSTVQLERLCGAFVLVDRATQLLPLLPLLKEQGAMLPPQTLVSVIHCCGQSGRLDENAVQLLGGILQERLSSFPTSVLPVLASALAHENVRSVTGVEELALLVHSMAMPLISEFTAKESCYLLRAFLMLRVSYHRKIGTLISTACHELPNLSAKDLAILLHAVAKQSDATLSGSLVRKVKSAMEETVPNISRSTSVRTVLTLCGSLKMLRLSDMTMWLAAVSDYVEDRLEGLLRLQPNALAGILGALWFLDYDAPGIRQSLIDLLHDAQVEPGNAYEYRNFMLFAVYCCRGNGLPSSVPAVLSQMRTADLRKLTDVQERFCLMRLHALSVRHTRVGLYKVVSDQLRRWCTRMVRRRLPFMLECGKHLKSLLGESDAMRWRVDTVFGSFVDIALLLNEDGFPVSWKDQGDSICTFKFSKALLTRRKVRPVALCAVPVNFTCRFSHRPLGMVSLATQVLEIQCWEVVLVNERTWDSAEDKKEFVRSLLTPLMTDAQTKHSEEL